MVLDQGLHAFRLVLCTRSASHELLPSIFKQLKPGFVAEDDLPPHLSSPLLVRMSEGESSCALPFIPEADRMNLSVLFQTVFAAHLLPSSLLNESSYRPLVALDF